MNKLRPCEITWQNRILRQLWTVVWVVLFRPSPRFMHSWRRFLLRCFGAQIESGVHVYPSAKVWAPWNLKMDKGSCLAEHVDCYCVDEVFIGVGATVSQYSFLCTASHNYSEVGMPLMIAPISIGAHSWITADVFVAPGVEIGEGAVVTARSSVFDDIDSWVVASGSPAEFRKARNKDSVFPEGYLNAVDVL